MFTYRAYISLHFSADSLSINESFARSAVAAFCAQLNPTLDEITDIKTVKQDFVWDGDAANKARLLDRWNSEIAAKR